MKKLLPVHRNLNTVVPVFLFLIAALIYSCKAPSPFPGYEDAANGSWLMMLKKSGSTEPTAEVGGAVFVHMKFKTAKDSLMFDLNENQYGQDMSYPIEILKPRFIGDFMDLLMKFHKGDSGSYYIRLDSLKKYYNDSIQFNFNNPKYDTMKYVGFAVRVDSIYSKKKLADYFTVQKKLMAIQQAAQDTVMALRKIAMGNEPDLKKNDAKYLKKYIADNKITIKPDADGIYFWETDQGTKNPIQPGMPVAMHYTGRYLNGDVFDSNWLVDGQDPYPFRVVTDQMVEGFTKCILKMHTGGRATFILPPAMAYKDSLTRIFDVQLVEQK